MAHINLLPWREAQRQKHKKEYVATLAMVALCALALFWGIGAVVDNMITAQQQRNDFLNQQIAVLDGQIAKIKDIKEQKKQVEQRMALIEQLQANRNAAPHVLDELARIVPPGVSFITLSRKNNRMDIMGISESNNRLSEFMRRLEESKVFTNGDLSSIVADTSKSDAVSEFKLTFNISPSIAPELLTAGTTEGKKK